MQNFAPIGQKYTELIQKVKKEEAELAKWRTRHTAVQMDLEAEIAKRGTHLNAVQAAEMPLEPDPPPAENRTRAEPPWSMGLMLAIAVGVGAVGGLILAMLAMGLNRPRPYTPMPLQ